MKDKSLEFLFLWNDLLIDSFESRSNALALAVKERRVKIGDREKCEISLIEGIKRHTLDRPPPKVLEKLTSLKSLLLI